MSMSDTWTEVNLSEDGVSVTVYEESSAGDALVVDEFWMTHDELRDESNYGSYSLGDV